MVIEEKITIIKLLNVLMKMLVVADTLVVTIFVSIIIKVFYVINVNTIKLIKYFIFKETMNHVFNVKE